MFHHYTSECHNLVLLVLWPHGQKSFLWN
uniref:Uncharacterized protein n=1 Tax=Anguilla anguilla TaxID=7936 RepID=A0A0E9T059_ANGAN